MSVEKLRAWLQLPSGPWPPDHYSLIGLSPGEGTPADIESRVLDRLERLRRYQLAHPDEATEGMNLLARALDTLTDPESRREYDAKLGVKKSLPALPEDLAGDFPPNIPPLPPRGLAMPVGPHSKQGEPIVSPVFPDLILLPNVEDELEIDDDPEFITDGDSEEIELPEAILVPVLPAIAKLEGSAQGSKRRVSRRREIYVELARIRKVLRVLERARPYLVDAERTFSRRTDSLALMGCLAELRPLLPTVADLIGTPNRPGFIVAALVRQRLAFDTLQSFLPSQRESLAKDFRAAHFRVASFYDELRGRVRRRTEKGWDRRVLGPMLRHLAKYPEWFLLPISLGILIVAAIRSLHW